MSPILSLSEQIDIERAAGVVLTALDVSRLQALDAHRAETLRRVWHPADRHVDGLSAAFHLGTVGGSGRNVGRLNGRRARLLDRTIDAAVRNVPLYRKAETLVAAMARILSGEETETARGERAAKQAAADAALAARIAALKKGDLLLRWTVLAVYSDRDGYPSTLAYRDADGLRHTLPITKALFRGDVVRYRVLNDVARARVGKAEVVQP